MLVQFDRPDTPVSAPDKFVQRYTTIRKQHNLRKRSPYYALLFPEQRRLIGTYEDWKSFVEDAVAEDAPPSRELILGNTHLVAWESFLNVGRVSSFPVSIGFSITDVCNARCNFCAYAPERVAESRLTVDSIRTSDWLKFCKIFRPNAGLGEPFAHPKSTELFAALKDQAPFIDIGSITNGSLLRPAVIDVIVDWFKFLYVSVNASKKETYEITMRPLKWERLVSNLTALRDAKIKAGSAEPRLDAGFVVHRHNLDDLPDLPRFLRTFGFSRLNVKPMVPPPNCSTSSALLTSDDSIFVIPEHANEVFRELERQCVDSDIALIHPLPSRDMLLNGGRPNYGTDQ